MPIISSLGIGSGIDLNGLLDQLEAAERNQLNPITVKQASYEAKISAYGRLDNSLNSFQDAVARLKDPALFSSLSSQVDGEGITASGGGNAQPGRYDVSVTQLARAQNLASAGFSARDAALGGGTLSLTVGGKSSEIHIAEDASSLEDIRDAINATEDAGVRATIVNDGDPDAPYRLVLTSQETGSAATIAALSFTASGDQKGLESSLSLSALEETVPARNAELTVNGIAISSASNQVEGALEGVTLTLSATGDSTVKIEHDNAVLRDAITTLVSEYNDLQGTIGQLTSFDADGGTAGELLGDSTMRHIEARLRSGISASIEGDGLNSLSALGITLQLDGTLEFDDDQIDELVTHQRDELAAFFSGTNDASGEEQAGFAARLGTTLGNILDPGGLLDNATTGIETRMKSLDAQYARTERTIDATVQRYRRQFSQLDIIVARLNQTSSRLTQQFDALNAQNNQ